MTKIAVLSIAEMGSIVNWLLEEFAEMSFTFAELLALTPARSLRAIATHLGVRQREHVRKEEWRAAILAYWQQPDSGAALPPAAYAAYQHLRSAGQLPAALFWAEYGPLRLPDDGEAARPPWQAPQTISEALYYRGLLHPVGHRQIRKAPWLTTPIDLPIVDPLTTAPALTPAPARGLAANPWPLLHDVAQYLIYRQQQPALALLHDHWLPPSQLQALNRRLLRPAAAPLPRSHKATPILSLLTFLAQAAGFVDAAGITASGWQWLADPPAYQLQTLWQGWCAAAAPLRARHEQPAAFLPAPWPQPFLQWLGQQQAAFSAQQAAAYLLGAQPALADYFVAHLAAASDLAQLLAPLLAFDLCQLGLLTPLDAAPSPPSAALLRDPQRLYSLTAIGAWLLHPTLAAPAFGPSAGTDDAPATAEQPAPLSLPGLLTVPVDLPFPLQARLAAYADYSTAAPTAAGARTQHTYEVTAATVARAAAQQQPLAVLVATLHALRGPLDHGQMSWLQAAYAAGRTLQLAYLPLLRSDSAARMAALQQDGRLDGLWGEWLGPTAVTLLAALPEVHTRLQQAGYMAPVPLPSTGSGDGTGASTTADPPALIAPALLWLAGRLYQALGEHIPTLTPLPSAALDQLWQQLDLAAQAVVQSQCAQIHTQLAQLLDGYHLMPPTLPALYAVDHAALRQQLERALAARQGLRIHYYTAGRNLLTERQIEPYWLEERHGNLYLRAYCHQAGRVLIFRVDRIQAVLRET